MKDLIYRFRFLLKGNFYAFWHYKEPGFTQLNFRGIPIIQRDDCPSGTFYLLNDNNFDTPRRKDGKLDKRYNINKFRYDN